MTKKIHMPSSMSLCQYFFDVLSRQPPQHQRFVNTFHAEHTDRTQHNRPAQNRCTIATLSIFTPANTSTLNRQVKSTSLLGLTAHRIKDDGGTFAAVLDHVLRHGRDDPDGEGGEEEEGGEHVPVAHVRPRLLDHLGAKCNASTSATARDSRDAHTRAPRNHADRARSATHRVQSVDDKRRRRDCEEPGRNQHITEDEQIDGAGREVSRFGWVQHRVTRVYLPVKYR